MGKKHIHKTSNEFKIAQDFSVMINGLKLPKGAVYGTYLFTDTPIKFVSLDTNCYKTIEVYFYTPWKSWELHQLDDSTPIGKWLLSKMRDLPIEHTIDYGYGVGIASTFQRTATHHGKSTAWKEANKRYLSRHDNNDFIYDRINGESNYNYNTPYKKTKAYY